MQTSELNSTSEAIGDDHRNGVVARILGLSIPELLALALVTTYLFGVFQHILGEGKAAPLVGLRSAFEPVFLLRLRFTTGARGIIHGGYTKFKDSWFRLARNDRDVIVLSNKYVEELRSLPNSKISAIQALISNLGYSQSELLLESDLHFQTLQKKVTPNLHTFTDAMKADIEYTKEHDFPSIGAQWKEVILHDLMAKLVQRLSARVFVGEPACRDSDWLEASTKYVENASLTVFIMRATPGWMQSVVVRLLPSYWRAASWGNRAVQVLCPIIRARREAAGDLSFARPNDFLQGMIELANEHDGLEEKLARRALIMGLASIHLTTIAAEHVLYDIFARPEYIEPLREELESTLAEEGGTWTKATFGKLRKLDSVLRESQRLSPPSLLAGHRIVQEKPVLLSDGKVLPPGQHICLPAYETSKDPSIVAGDEFDGLRYFRMREHGSPEDAQKHQFASIDRSHLHFGVGHNACPGRWFASNLLKMMVGEMLLCYDLKFLEGQGRPPNMYVDEFIIIDPTTKTCLRQRA